MVRYATAVCCRRFQECVAISDAITRHRRTFICAHVMPYMLQTTSTTTHIYIRTSTRVDLSVITGNSRDSGTARDAISSSLDYI